MSDSAFKSPSHHDLLANTFSLSLKPDGDPNERRQRAVVTDSKRVQRTAARWAQVEVPQDARGLGATRGRANPMAVRQDAAASTGRSIEAEFC